MIYVVGLGPGNKDAMTIAADAALRESDVIVGYKTYIDLIRELYPDKEFVESPMRGEIERCHTCLELARSGKTVALVCSGDAGIYGMASPMLEEAGDDVEIKVIPGVTAALSGAAVLGAPIAHDMCTISLSDLLTPWEVIERRLKSAAEGDFCIAIYNPASHKRVDYLKKACDILLSILPPDRECGYVANIGRSATSSTICSLAELADKSVDMFTTVFIGNSATYVKDGRLITPRGYDKK